MEKQWQAASLHYTFVEALPSAAWLSPTELAVTVIGLSNTQGGSIKVTIAPELANTSNATAVTRPATDPWRVTYHKPHVWQVDTAKVGKPIYATRDYVFTGCSPSWLPRHIFTLKTAGWAVQQPTIATFRSKHSLRYG